VGNAHASHSYLVDKNWTEKYTACPVGIWFRVLVARTFVSTLPLASAFAPTTI